VHGIDSVGHFKSALQLQSQSQTGSETPAAEAGDEKKEISNEKPAAEAEPAAAAEKVKDADKNAEQTTGANNGANDSAEPAAGDKVVDAKSGESDAVVCENRTASEDSHEKTDEAVGAASLSDPERCAEKIAEADKKVDEDGPVDEMKTVEAEVAEEKTSCDGVAMETDEVQNNTSGSTSEGQDSSRIGEENKTKDDGEESVKSITGDADEPMETDTADGKNAVDSETGRSPQNDELQPSSETQMETSDTTSDKPTDNSADVDKGAAAVATGSAEEKEKADTDGSNGTVNTAKQSDISQNAGGGDCDKVENNTSDTKVTDKVGESDGSGDKKPTEQTDPVHSTREGNVAVCSDDMCLLILF